MGRFDALTHLEEEKNDTSAPLPVASSPIQRTVPAQQLPKPVEKTRKPEIMNSGNHYDSPTIDSFKNKPSKYSTLLDAALIKKIKLFAAERELKDYEVIELALTDYFDRQRSS